MNRSFESRKRLLLVTASVWLLAVTGCTDNCSQFSENYQADSESCDICTEPPDDCTGLIPETAVLSIHLSQPLPVLVRVYSGKAYETGVLMYQKAPTSRDFSIELPLGDYSATALYVTGGDTTLSIDGDALDYRSLGTCDKNCYAAEGGDVDLKRQ